MGIFSLLLALTIMISGCELPGAPGGGGAGLVILLPGAPGGPDRAVTDPGSIGHDAVQRLLTYEITLSRPGSQSVTKAAPYSQSIRFDQLEPGEWTVTTNAFFRGHGNLQANDPNSTYPGARPKTVSLVAGRTESVPVTLELASKLKGLVLIPDAETLKRIGTDWLNQGEIFLLLTDLTLDNWAGPEIHGPAPSVRASFIGGGHTIRINSFAAGVGKYGLFSSAHYADIIDLNIDLHIGAGPADTAYAGGLVAGADEVNIKGVHVSGILHLSSSASPPSYAGGIAGVLSGSLSGGNIALCSSTLDLEMENSIGDSVAGGLVGEIYDAEVSTSWFTGTVKAEAAGGIAGEIDGATILDSFSSGTVEGYTAGGIVGQAISGSSNATTIKHCYSTGTVKGGWNAGGIAGSFEGQSGSTIGVCYATGIINLSCPSANAAGGIAGYIGSTGGINDCLVLDPTVTGPAGSAVGRIAGFNYYGTLTNNLALGGTFTEGGTPIIPNNNAANTDGGTISSISSAPPDFDTTAPSSAFADPPPGWGYPYPVLSWQIGKGIRP
jgi:hypothetical protein